MVRNLGLSLLLWLGTIAIAHAQSPPSGFDPCASASLSVSGTSANTQLSTCGPTVVIWNIGAQEAFIALGTASNTVATSASVSIPSGTGTVVQAGLIGQYLAAITATGTTTLRISQGFGFPALGSIPGDGTGGSTPVRPAAVTPAAGTASAIVTGGTAVTIITGPVNGCYVVNPLAATDQNISVAEVAYLNPVTTATASGRGTNSLLQPGQAYSCPAAMTTNLSFVAATTAHALNVVVW